MSKSFRPRFLSLQFKLPRFWLPRRRSQPVTPRLEDISESTVVLLAHEFRCGDKAESDQKQRHIRSSSSCFRDEKEDEEIESHHTFCLGTLGPNASWSTFRADRTQEWIELDAFIQHLFSTTKEDKIFQSEKQLATLHRHIETLLESKIGQFVCDWFKVQLLKKGFQILKTKLESKSVPVEYFNCLAEIWDHFYIEILSTLTCLLYRLQVSITCCSLSHVAWPCV